MIKNYGLFWERNGVFFGELGRGNPASLLGETVEKRKKVVVNFSRQVGIYCLYDANFSLLYVGKAGDGNSTILSRLRNHTGNDLAERWTRFSWFGLRPVEKKGQDHALGETDIKSWTPSLMLRALEGVLILGAEPSLNRQGANFSGARKYKQHWDTDNLYPRQSQMIKDIWDGLPD